MENQYKSVFGKTKDGVETYLYLLKNGRGMEAYVTDFGASLVRLLISGKDGVIKDVVLGYDDAAGYERGDAGIGATVGRNANRIGRAEIEVNGITYSLEKNDNGNNLHSGPDYYQKRIWQVEVYEKDRITFLLHSPDGDQGYPGAVDMRVTYRTEEDNTLSIHYEAVPDKDTVINMTNHSYFNLNGHDSGSVLGHKVKLDADFFTPSDAESVPTGEIRSVDGTPMDFRAEKTLGSEIDGDYEPLRFGGGYDHNWVLKNEGRFAKVAEVMSETSGIKMEVYTDLPGIQIYTANYLNHEPGKDGAFYERRSAVCLETQFFPDSIHHENFQSPICKKGEKYDTRTSYRFLTE